MHQLHGTTNMTKKRNGQTPCRLDAFVVWPLCLFCIFQKSIDVLFKSFFVYLCIVISNFFAVNNRHAFKRHIVVIALYVDFSASGTAIAELCPIVKFLVIPGDEMPKFINGNLKIGECLSQTVIKGIKIFRPFGRNRIESFKFSQENISEIGRGNGKTIQAIVETGKIGDNASHDESSRYLPSESGDDIEEAGHKFVRGMWYGLIIAVIIFFIFAQRRE